MINALIFDFDGLMVDSEPLHFATEKSLIEKYGGKFTIKIFERTLGKSVADTLNFYKEIFNLQPSLRFLVKEHDRIFIDLVDKELTIMEGVYDLLSLLKKYRVKYSIASSGKLNYIKKALKKFNLLDEFKNKITSIEMVKRGKPAPDLFLHAAQQLKENPKNCLVLEDAENGIKAALNANMHAIYVNKKPISDNKLGHIKQIKKLSRIDTKLLNTFSS